MGERRLEIEEVRSTDALATLKPEWQDLVQRASTASIYQTWEWNEAWWRAFGSRKRLRLTILRTSGRIVGIAPLYLSFHLNTPLRRLAFLGTGVSDYLDLILDDDFAREGADFLLQHLCRSSGFDLCDLQQLRPGSLLLDSACAAGNDTALPSAPSILPQEPCPFVKLPESWDAYTKSVGKKMRSNLSYYDRLLSKTFEDVEFRLTGADDLDAAMDALFELHQKRWKARLLPGVMGGERIRGFHRTVARRFQANDWLRLHLIALDGGIVSALYCFEFREKYYYYLGGFAPDLGRYSLGTVLTARALKHAIERGCKEFDFLRGNEPYKYRWQPEERINHRVLVADSTGIRSRVMLGLNRLERCVEHRAKQFAENRGRSKK